MPVNRLQEDAEVLENQNYRGDYFLIRLRAPGISAAVQPGQFVDVELPNTPHLLMRRPFSVYDAEGDALAVLYKRVGQGTALMAELQPGAKLNLLGPLGNGFPPPPEGKRVLLVAGGYGCAATYLIAKRMPNPGTCLIGGRTAADLLLDDKFREAYYEVAVSTDDGSEGHHGVVTDLLERELQQAGPELPVVYACGPNAMLRAVARCVLAREHDAYLSLDQNMCCGVGACYSCVVKLKADTPEGWRYVRTCREGPVFPASDVYWDD